MWYGYNLTHYSEVSDINNGNVAWWGMNPVGTCQHTTQSEGRRVQAFSEGDLQTPFRDL